MSVMRLTVKMTDETLVQEWVTGFDVDRSGNLTYVKFPLFAVTIAAEDWYHVELTR